MDGRMDAWTPCRGHGCRDCSASSQHGVQAGAGGRRSGPDTCDVQIPIHSFPTTLFSAAMAERDARYDVLGLSGDGTL